MQRQWRSQKTRKPSEGISAAKRLDSIARRDGKAIPIYSNTFGKLSAGRSTVCVRTAEFFLKQKAHRTAIRCAFCIAYYTIPRAIRELWPQFCVWSTVPYYTIPRAIRELWHSDFTTASSQDYTIPRAIRELWHTTPTAQTRCNYTIPRAIRELWLWALL